MKSKFLVASAGNKGEKVRSDCHINLELLIKEEYLQTLKVK